MLSQVELGFLAPDLEIGVQKERNKAAWAMPMGEDSLSKSKSS